MKSRGFGLLAMLGFCCFLGVCITISAIGYQEVINVSAPSKITGEIAHYRMENDYSAVSTLYADTKEYKSFENMLENGAKAYMKDYPIETENKIIISFTTLKSKKIIDDFYDSNGNLCRGYVIYYPASHIYDGYIKCGMYKSPNYLSRLE